MANLTFKPNEKPEDKVVRQFLQNFAGNNSPINELNTSSITLAEQVATAKERERILAILDKEEERSGFDTIKISRLRKLIEE